MFPRTSRATLLLLEVSVLDRDRTSLANSPCRLTACMVDIQSQSQTCQTRVQSTNVHSCIIEHVAEDFEPIKLWARGVFIWGIPFRCQRRARMQGCLSWPASLTCCLSRDYEEISPRAHLEVARKGCISQDMRATDNQVHVDKEMSTNQEFRIVSVSICYAGQSLLYNS